MADNQQPGRPEALSGGDVWSANTLAHFFSPRMVLVVLAVVAVALAVLARIVAQGQPDLQVKALISLVAWIGGIYAFFWRLIPLTQVCLDVVC